MGHPLDTVPLSGISEPFRLDHGDISFDTPAPIREAMKRALDAGETKYVQTGGLAAGRSQSWAMAEHLIRQARVGSIPGVDFGAVGEGYIRCCFARDPRELDGALASMREALVRPASSGLE